MAKGRKAPLGQETENQNGYVMVKTSTGWRLKHHLVAEEKLGRFLEKDERVVFIDGDRTNLDPDNLAVNKKQIRVSQVYDNRMQSLEDKMSLFVEEAPDKSHALDDLLALLNDVRINHGFMRISER